MAEASELAERLSRVEAELDRLKAMLARQQVEEYTDERVAEFLLSNAVDAESYRAACEKVKQMGLDPAEIEHWTPAGGW
ncbi:MAG: hypothetical protein WDZ59_11210 [Pirellulales bacterium]